MSAEEHKKSRWNRRLISIIGAITFIATIIGMLPTIQSYYNSWKTKNIEGKWKFTCHIKSSSYKPYIGKSSGYKIYFTQDENKLCGKGEMCWVDDKEIPYEQHIPITIEGKADGSIIVLSYTLNGAKRTTVGAFNLDADSPDVLIGTFSGTAADTKGTVVGERIID